MGERSPQETADLIRRVAQTEDTPPEWLVELVHGCLEAALRARPAAGGTEERFAELRYLPRGWDSYDAPAITPVAVASAQAWHAAVNVVPTSHGGVQLEWHLGGVDVEVTFDAAGRIVGLLTALAPTERSETDG